MLCTAAALIVTLSFSGCATTQKKSAAVPGKKVSTTVPTSNNNNSSSSKGSGKSSETESTSKPFTPIILSNISGLQTKKVEWSWEYSPRDYAAMLEKYHGYAFGDTSKKVIYLSFDEGYEYGCTGSILDTLKADNVKATFFCTKPYVTASFKGVPDSDLVKRMANEGHIIGNHTVRHLSMPDIHDEKTFDAELTGVEDAVAAIPGCKVSKFFRPPMGDFSEQSLYYAQKLGYRTIFFAFAYYDYDVNKQPNPETAKALILKNTKPGMIILLHAESKTNAEILDSLIKTWRSEGYTFKTLNDLT